MSALVREAADALGELGAILAEAGRLEAILLLGEVSIEASRGRAARMAEVLSRASDVLAIAEERFGAAPGAVSWSPETNRILSAGSLEGEAVLERAAELFGAVAAAEWRVDEVLGRSPLLDGARRLVRQAGNGLARPKTEVASSSPTRAFTGPASAPLDPVFALGPSLLDQPREQPVSPLDAVPAVWTLAAQEHLAVQVCALCIAEYDGLPISFYRDMAQQADDEARHARFFLECALEALPGFVRDAPEEHPMRAGAVRFLATGQGLTLPAEGAFFSVFHRATLFERLVLLQVDGERGATGRLRTAQKAAFFQEHRQYADGLALTIADEDRHERMGERWLAHLVPDEAERARQFEDAMVHRGVLLAAAFAEARGQSFPDLLSSMGITSS